MLLHLKMMFAYAKIQIRPADIAQALAVCLALRTDRQFQQEVFAHHRLKINESCFGQNLAEFVCIFLFKGIQFIKLCTKRLQECFQAAHTINRYICLKIPLNQNALHHTVDPRRAAKIFKHLFGIRLKAFRLKAECPVGANRLVD